MEGQLRAPRIRPSVSPDAVVVVPGIMGSTLESDAGVLWGFHKLSWYRKAWSLSDDTQLDSLALSEDEQELALKKCDPTRPLTTDDLAGRFGGIQATGLLRMPAWAPFLRGLEPYTGLVKRISDVVVHDDAILEFAYDWRLPVAYNARRLAYRVREHHERWLAHPEYLRFRDELPDTRPARVVIVAHSMGGLLARSLPDGLDIRATITLGTPFDGAAMAPLVLNTGRGTPVPLPSTRLRRMVKTLPGIHDLLPTYRCLDHVETEDDPTRLTPDLVAEIGGSRDLAVASFAWQRQTQANVLPNHHPVVGVAQPTDSTLTLKNGVLTGHRYSFSTSRDGIARDRNGFLDRTLAAGDGTVPRNSAEPHASGLVVSAYAQQHGGLASIRETADFVRDVLRQHDPRRPRLGDGEIGLEVPDIAPVNEPMAIILSGVDSPGDATVRVFDEDGRHLYTPALHKSDRSLRATWSPTRPGIYRVVVKGGGPSAVTQRFMVMPA